MKRILIYLILCMLFCCGCSYFQDSEDNSIVSNYCGRNNNLPWTGCWREVNQIICESSVTFVPDIIILEFRLKADGSFYVTWEYPTDALYVDYWGNYVVDKEAGTITITVTKSNYLPDDIDGEGKFEISEDGNLILTEMFLGSYPRDTDITNTQCGHEFAPFEDQL